MLTVAALAVSAGFGVAAHEWRDAFAFAPVLLAFAGVGAIVASHRPGNAIGWLFRAEGLWGALGVAAGTTPVRGAIRRPTGGRELGGLARRFRGEAYCPLFLALLLFPDGRLPSPRWRPAAWLIVAANALLLAVTATSDVAFAQAAPGVAAPVRLIPHRIADPWLDNLEVVMLFLFILSAAGCAVRYRRSGGVVRQQIKWFAYAGIIAALGFVILAFTTNDPAIAFIVLVPFVPVAAGIAIIKYRLYDIDVVISKTIVYGSLAAFITPSTSSSWPGSARSDPAPCRRARARTWACRSWRPRWWRWRSSRSGSGCSGWPTGWCSASGPPRMRRSASSPAGWGGPTPPTTSCRGWPGSWPRAPGPAARWCG